MVSKQLEKCKQHYARYKKSSSFNKNEFRKNAYLLTYTKVIDTDMLISQNVGVDYNS